MPRPKGSATLGPVRSLRLPLDLDRWFEQRLRDESARPASDILLEAVHGGLRLRSGYMNRHRQAMAAFVAASDRSGYESYVRALTDSFGIPYVKHLEAWLLADGVLPLDSALNASDTSQTTAKNPTMANPSQPAGDPLPAIPRSSTVPT
jgi:hypothetical protein